MLWSVALPTPPVPNVRVLSLVRPIWEQMRAKSRMAGPILSQALRQTRALGSHERPIAGDLLLGLIRHERALARIAADPIEAWLKLAQEGVPTLPDPPNAYAVALSLPDWLAQEWWERLGEERAIALAKTLAGRAPVCLRVLREPVELPVPFRRVGERSIILEGRCNLLATDAWRNGQVEIQDLGSQRIVEAAFPGVGARVLDLCAGAGGKSLALAAMGAKVQAWDVRPDALRELEKRAGRCGLSVKIAPPSGSYDMVLVDAPCSGTGVLRRHPENRWKFSFPVETQAKLLEQARKLAPRVVYATCALTLRENEEQLRPWKPEWQQTLWPEVDGQDGFYMAGLS